MMNTMLGVLHLLYFFTVILNGGGWYFQILYVSPAGFIVQYTLFCQFCPLLWRFNRQFWGNRGRLGASLCLLSQSTQFSFIFFFPSLPLLLLSDYPCRCNSRLPHLDLQVFEALVVKFYPTLCDTMNCSLPGSSVQGILQAKILEWVAISFSRGSS